MPTKASEATKGEAKVMKNASLKKPVANPPRIHPKDISNNNSGQGRKVANLGTDSGRLLNVVVLLRLTDLLFLTL